MDTKPVPSFYPADLKVKGWKLSILYRSVAGHPLLMSSERIFCVRLFRLRGFVRTTVNTS